MPRPMRPAPRQTICSRMLMASLESLAQHLLKPRPAEMAEPQAAQGPPRGHEILAADRAADGRKGACERRRHARTLADREQKRQADAGIFQHVTMGRQHDALAPVAGISEAVVRAAAVHPLL